MHNTIIGVYGRAGEGKSTTVKEVCRLLLSNFPHAIPSTSPINYGGDIFLTIQIGQFKIGIESQGDPDSRMFQTLEQLANVDKCEIIVCTTRTRSSTVHEVDRIADKYGYHTLWISSFFTPSEELNIEVLNNQAALNIIEIIRMLMNGDL